jgi:hypothetical protein
VPLLKHGPHIKRHVQQFFYYCVCTRCRSSVFTEPLPNKDRGIHIKTLIEGFYEVCHWDGLMCHDMHTKFHKDLLRHWKDYVEAYNINIQLSNVYSFISDLFRNISVISPKCFQFLCPSFTNAAPHLLNQPVIFSFLVFLCFDRDTPIYAPMRCISLYLRHLVFVFLCRRFFLSVPFMSCHNFIRLCPLFYSRFYHIVTLYTFTRSPAALRLSTGEEKQTFSRYLAVFWLLPRFTRFYTEDGSRHFPP